MTSHKLNIVVIGGGAAGVTVASSLSESLDPKVFNIQLVTDRNYNIHYPAMIRAMTTPEGGFADLALNPFDKLFLPGKAGEIVNGAVDHVEDGEVHLADGRVLPYDWLVLATGTTWDGPLNLPLDREDARKWVAEWHEKFAKARSIVVLGAGAAGIEFTGEIRQFLPDKKVTLVHNQEGLLNNAYPSKFRANLLGAVKAKGVNVILNDRVDLPGGESFTSVTTKKGVVIDADLVIPVRGGKVNTSFLSTFDKSIFGPSSRIKVLPTLQVPLANGKKNVFAVGDIIEWPEQKTLSKVPAQAAVVVSNILSSTKGQAAKKEYSGFMELIVVPLGPSGGRGYIPLLWGLTLGDFLSRTLKSKKLFVDMPIAMLHLKPSTSLGEKLLLAVKSTWETIKSFSPI